MSIGSVDSTVEALRFVLGRTSRRAEVVASNLANVDTPGYRALQVTFDEMLPGKGGLEAVRTDPGHASAGSTSASRGRVTELPATRMRIDGNTVDVDREMTMMAMVQGRYRATAELLRKRFALLTYAATDGRGS